MVRVAEVRVRGVVAKAREAGATIRVGGQMRPAVAGTIRGVVTVRRAVAVVARPGRAMELAAPVVVVAALLVPPVARGAAVAQRRPPVPLPARIASRRARRTGPVCRSLRTPIRVCWSDRCRLSSGR